MRKDTNNFYVVVALFSPVPSQILLVSKLYIYQQSRGLQKVLGYWSAIVADDVSETIRNNQLQSSLSSRTETGWTLSWMNTVGRRDAGRRAQQAGGYFIVPVYIFKQIHLSKLILNIPESREECHLTLFEGYLLIRKSKICVGACENSATAK